MSTAILAPGSRGRRLSKRLLQVVITLFGLLLLTFTIGRVMPIDPVLAIVGPDADQSTYQQVYHQLGFDQSLMTQFGIYFVNLLHGDLGNGVVPRRTGLMTVDARLAGNGQVFWNAINHLILPASLLGFHSLAYISRMTRSFMLAQLSQEFIITARVKGLTERQVIWNHAFRNILVQLLTVVALAYGALLEGAVLIETVFSWPGFGSYLTGSLLLGDMNAVMGCVLLVGVIFVMLNLLSDMLYQFFDPRTKS